MKQITWNLKPLFGGDDDPAMKKSRKLVFKESYDFINKWKNRTDYLRDPSMLRKALDEYELWRRKYGSDGNEGYYFSLRTAQDQNDPELKARFNMVEDFGKKIENDIQFFSLRIAKIPEEDQRIFLANESLKKYRHYLTRLFQEAKYLLSEPEERIMNLKASTSYSNWVRMTSSFLSREERDVLTVDGKKERKSFSEIASLMNKKEKRVRDSAARAFNDILDRNVDIAEAEINSVLANKK
ncbi:MAG TPA: hypothetical protein VK435_08810, partial [Thermodesulfovibrionales bacterium]|nr:hypothetical protein [Thermodesulfovibrionales bacterium]